VLARWRSSALAPGAIGPWHWYIPNPSGSFDSFNCTSLAQRSRRTRIEKIEKVRRCPRHAQLNGAIPGCVDSSSDRLIKSKPPKEPARGASPVLVFLQTDCESLHLCKALAGDQYRIRNILIWIRKDGILRIRKPQQQEQA
jgi:hypothetical protein